MVDRNGKQTKKQPGDRRAVTFYMTHTVTLPSNINYEMNTQICQP